MEKRELPKIKIVSNPKEGTKIYQDDKEIEFVLNYELKQEGNDRMPTILLEIGALEVEAEIEEAQVIEKQKD